MQFIAPAALLVFGVATALLGRFTLRNASSVVSNSNEELTRMFGSSEQFGPLFAQQPKTDSARIAGIGFVAVGAVLVIVAIVLVIVGFANP